MGLILVVAVLCLPSAPFTEGVLTAGESLPKKLILLDAGHGGIDGGASGVNLGEEAPLNLAFAEQLKPLLELFGCEVNLTRTTHAGLEDADAGSIREKKRSDMHRRLAMAGDMQQGVFISLHQNASPYHSANGSVVYYSKNHPGSKLLAEGMQQRIIGSLQPNNRRVTVGAGSQLYLLHKATWPAVLVECGFITNAKEEEQLHDPAYQKQLCLCLAAGFADAWPALWQAASEPDATV